MRKLFFTIFVMGIVLSGCADSSEEVYSYSDGAGNAYFISATSLVYNPVTPLKSSSGEYSGGSPAEVALTAEEYEMLIGLLESAINSTANQIENREKMSGYIQKGDLGVVLAPGSEIQVKIERALQDFLAKKQ